jgi:AcrR family transcriptional regulator
MSKVRTKRGRPPASDEHRAEERRRIGLVAEDLFHAEGYESVSMRGLAAAAGCAPMTLYAYFENKADILREIWRRMLEDLFQSLEKKASAVRDPARRLRLLCEGYVRYWLDHPERYRMVFMTSGVSQSDVGVFVADDGMAQRFALFIDALDKCAPGAPKLKLRGETLICGLHGIAHSHVTISQFPWETAERQVACLVEAFTKDG